MTARKNREILLGTRYRNVQALNVFGLYTTNVYRQIVYHFTRGLHVVVSYCIKYILKSSATRCGIAFAKSHLPLLRNENEESNRATVPFPLRCHGIAPLLFSCTIFVIYRRTILSHRGTSADTMQNTPRLSHIGCSREKIENLSLRRRANK